MDVEKHNELADRKFTKSNYNILYFFIEEDDEDDVIIPGVGPIAMHASNRDDPLLEIQDDVNYLLVFFSLHKYDYILGRRFRC
jgi:hypothetical protein